MESLTSCSTAETFFDALVTYIKQRTKKTQLMESLTFRSTVDTFLDALVMSSKGPRGHNSWNHSPPVALQKPFLLPWLHQAKDLEDGIIIIVEFWHKSILTTFQEN